METIVQRTGICPTVNIPKYLVFVFFRFFFESSSLEAVVILRSCRQPYKEPGIADLSIFQNPFALLKLNSLRRGAATETATRRATISIRSERRRRLYATMCRLVTCAALLAALSCAGFAQAQDAMGHNESCSHAEGTCRKASHVTTGLLPPAMAASDQALLGQIEKDWGSAAMRPAPLPSFLPSPTLGAGSVINLPQPNLKMDAKRDRAVPLAMSGSAADVIGLF